MRKFRISELKSIYEKSAIRIIKPVNIKIPEEMRFNIIDNDKIIGTGKISI